MVKLKPMLVSNGDSMMDHYFIVSFTFPMCEQCECVCVPVGVMEGEAVFMLFFFFFFLMIIHKLLHMDLLNALTNKCLLLLIIVDTIEAQQMSLENLKAIESAAAAQDDDDKSNSECVEQIHPETGQVLRVYSSARNDETFMGINKYSINSCLNGNTKTYAGFKWRFYDGPPLDCKYKISSTTVTVCIV